MGVVSVWWFVRLCEVRVQLGPQVAARFPAVSAGRGSLGSGPNPARPRGPPIRVAISAAPSFCAEREGDDDELFV